MSDAAGRAMRELVGQLGEGIGFIRQHRAIACHVSQAVPGSVLWRRLELQGDTETLAWLRPPTQGST